MRKQYLQSGKIVGTHGVRGMVRVQPWCDSNEVLCGFKKIYLNNGENELTVEQAKPHGNISLMKIKGVGPKVADCALLFSHKHIDAFPKDVWIKRAMAKLFDGELPACAVPYAGIAQQYIFHYARMTKLDI